MKHVLRAAVVALLVASPASAQMGGMMMGGDMQMKGPMVLKAARMLDVVSGRIIENATLVVEDGRITAVNPASTPEGAHTMDLGDVTLMPGFIDMHTHLVSQIGANSFTDAVTQTLADATLGAVKYGAITAKAGFTTVRDFGGDATVAFGKAVERGDVVGPHVIPSRAALGVTGGHCDVTGFAPGIAEQDWRDGVADGVDEVLKAVRYQVKHGAQVIKTCATAGVLSMEGPVGAQQYSYDELKAMVDEAARHGLKVAAHAHGSDGIMAAVKAGVASIEHGSVLTPEIITEMKARGTYLVPTTYLADRIPLDQLPPIVRAKAEQVLPIMRVSLENAIKAGVKIAFGTDAGVYPHGENAGEFDVYVKLGMSPIDALRTATINAADLLGKDDRGVLAEGKLADIIAVAGNPLEDIAATHDVRFVMVGGRPVKHVMGGMGH